MIASMDIEPQTLEALRYIVSTHPTAPWFSVWTQGQVQHLTNAQAKEVLVSHE